MVERRPNLRFPVGSESESMIELYIQWLYSLIGYPSWEYGHYWRVVRRLFMKEFYWIVNNDENRLHDGLDLRERFADDYNLDLEKVKYIIDGPCTVLEALVAFADRIDKDVMWQPDDESKRAFWFWSMLFNMGLDKVRFSDEYFDGEAMIELDSMIDRVLSRRYAKNGVGSLFPLRDPKKDQRRVELWYQMQYWISENFPF